MDNSQNKEKFNFNLDDIEETVIPNFKGGEGRIRAHMAVDENNRIMHGILEPGCSIGIHTHEGSSEIVFATKGEVVVTYDGIEEKLSAGMVHYCPDGHTHGMKNIGTENFEMLAVVPQHRS